MKDKIVSFFKGVWSSVATNSRDIISTLFWITAVLFVTQLIASVGNACSVDLHDIKNFVFAIGKFAAAALVGVGYISHITFRDSLGQHDQNEFMDTWKNVLKNPDLYRAVDPKDFLNPALNCVDCKATLTYLKQRYWQ